MSRSDKSRGHEVSDAKARSIVFFGLVLALTCVVTFVAMAALFYGLASHRGGTGLPERERKLPEAPRLQAREALDLRTFLEAEGKILNEYAWKDRAAGVVRIPVSRAIDIVTERQLPFREGGERQ